MSRIIFLAKSSNIIILGLVEYWSPYEQVLGALSLVNGGNHKGVKMRLASLHLTRHEAEVALALKLSQLIKPTN